MTRYITEISPSRYRGTLASIPQLLITVGVCSGYFICYGSVNIAGTLSWRLPFAFQSFLAFVFTGSALLFSPESPRWLSAVGRQEDALAVWEQLGVGSADREKSERAGIPEPVKMKDILSIFGTNARKQTAFGVFLMGMQQLSGIDGVLYVCSPWIFHMSVVLTNIVRTASFPIRGIDELNGIFPRLWYIRSCDATSDNPGLFTRRQMGS